MCMYSTVFLFFSLSLEQAEADADQAEGERDRPRDAGVQPGVRGGGGPVRRVKD